MLGGGEGMGGARVLPCSLPWESSASQDGEDIASAAALPLARATRT